MRAGLGVGRQTSAWSGFLPILPSPMRLNGRLSGLPAGVSLHLCFWMAAPLDKNLEHSLWLRRPKRCSLIEFVRLRTL